jgi:hypothetical protein
MAFDRDGIAGPLYLGGAIGAHKFWIYDTMDAIGTVEGSHYFNDPQAPRGFSVGDVVLVNIWATAIGTGGTLSSQVLCRVSAVVATSALYPAELNSSYDGAATVVAWSAADGIQNNYTAIIDPVAATDDITLGYEVGSKWLNTVSGEMWTCLDNTDGAAVWESEQSVTFNFNALSLLSNATAGSVTPGFKFRVVSLSSLTTAVNTTLGTNVTITPKITTTAITGMLITMASADVAGANYNSRSTAKADSVGSASAAINLVVGAHASTTGTADLALTVKRIA